ncbi:MAG: pyroglutamyl-peptidase I [Afipia sp.]|nr:pyroglutamyl-peptidase I [Afipia sp.]
MRRRACILITGFEPFPGAPYNPTAKLVERLLHLRRPALGDVDRVGHIFPVTYSAVDRQLPELIAAHRPDALLMFGLAGRTKFMRIETRARNTITQIWPDADHARVVHRGIVQGHEATRRFGPHTLRLLQAARATGIDARASINAGYYLCNYLSWRAIEATHLKDGPRLAAFIHVPLVARDAAHSRKTIPRWIQFEQLADAGEAMLISMVKLAKQQRLNAQI